MSRIPSVLDLPEKFRAFSRKLLALRLRPERHFSARDLLLTVLAGFLLILSRLIPAVRPWLSLAALLPALAPICLAVYRRVMKREIPLEEASILLAVLCVGLNATTRAASPVVLICYNLLCQVQGYCLLHREAAISDILEMAAIDPENSPERRILASASLGFFAIFALAGIVCAVIAIWKHVWLVRAAIFFILASPSAVLFSSFLTHFGAVYSGVKSHIFFRDGSIPEIFSRCRIFAFSKTGTVTDGSYVISHIEPVGLSEKDLLKIAAVAEYRSSHPIALALKAAAGLSEEAKIEVDTEEIPGRGVRSFFAGHQIYVGNAGLLEEQEIWCKVPSQSGSAIHVAMDGVYRGYIMISDALRDNAFEALEELRALGANTLVMLTGDVRSSARTLASSLNFDMVKPELSPDEKGSAVRYLRSVHGDRAKIACVGSDDPEMFDEADISVCLDGAGEADVMIRSGDITRVPLSFRICRTTERMLLICTLSLLAVKVTLACLGIAGVLHVGVIAASDCVLAAAADIWSLTSLTLDR